MTDNLKSTFKKELMMKWNDVKDSLPELDNPKDIHSQWCLLFRMHPIIYYVAYYTSNNEWRDGFGGVIENETHWMEITPPKEQTDE